MPMVPDIARPRARAASPGRDDADAMEKDSTTGRPRAGACGGGGCDGCADAVSSRGSGTRRRRGGSTDTVAGVWVAGRGGGGARGVWGGSAGASGAENEKWGGGVGTLAEGRRADSSFFFPSSHGPRPRTPNTHNAPRRGLPPGPGGHLHRQPDHRGLPRGAVPGRGRRPGPALVRVGRRPQEDAPVRHARGGRGCVALFVCAFLEEGGGGGGRPDGQRGGGVVPGRGAGWAGAAMARVRAFFLRLRTGVSNADVEDRPPNEILPPPPVGRPLCTPLASDAQPGHADPAWDRGAGEWRQRAPSQGRGRALNDERGASGERHYPPVRGRPSHPSPLLPSPAPPSPTRQDGPLCRLVDAHPVQRLHHGLHQALPGARLPV